MFYYEIWVGSTKFQGSSALTYSSTAKLERGQIVSIPLRNQVAMGFMKSQVTIDDDVLAPKIKPIANTTPYILPAASLKLHTWLMEYYPSPSGLITTMFLPPDLPKPRKESKQPLVEVPKTKLPPLTPDQKTALSQIARAGAQSVLLHGDTGTGKTRIYQQLTQSVITEGKSVIVLTPEIGLTPQLVQNFEQLFPGRVVVLHSNLTVAQRRDAYYQIIGSKEPLVVIGPRSALFAPLTDVGLMVLDEAHEQTYKQEQAPYYQATRVASQLARIHGAACIFGTATPDINDYYVFQEKHMPIVRMSTLATGKRVEPSVHIIDLTDRTQLTKSSMMSNELLNTIQRTIDAQQQVLLFLNRRGSARFILCQDCGWQALCPQCDIPLTFHADEHRLRCHTCGFAETIFTACPSCSSSEIIYTSPGTKALESEIQRLFPDLIVKRFDGDNLSADKLENNYPSLLNGEVNIIIGTQLITKGLDLPKLGTVGIINADTSLNFPDFTAEEKTYQQLTQVIGRAGRHQSQNSVVIQTYNAKSSLLETIVSKNWDKFFKQQIQERKQFGFPPFVHVMQLSVGRASQKSAQDSCQKLADDLRKTVSGIRVKGPAPRLHEKIRGKYHWQLIVSSKQRSKLIEVIAQLPAGWRHNLDPNNLM